MRQHNIEMNWRVNPIRSPKVKIVSLNFSLTLASQVLKGHDDHVITCLQFSGNRIVSGSDDNTLKVPNPHILHNCFMTSPQVWSAMTGKCLRTLVGHTGGLLTHTFCYNGAFKLMCELWSTFYIHNEIYDSGGVWSSQMANNVIVSGSTDRTLKVSNVSAVD